MEERYIAAIDLGSSKITLTVSKINGNDIQILYYKTAESSGIKNSAVINPSKPLPVVQSLVREAESELNMKINQVVVGLPRCDIHQESAHAGGERSNPDTSITVEEVENLKDLAQDSYPIADPQSQELYGAVAQSFSDEENFQMIESDIVGMVSRRFEGNFKLFVGKKSYVKNIEKIFNDLDVAVAHKYFTPYSTGSAVLSEEEMENGVALVDFGAGATSVTIYQGKILRYYGSIPFGGNIITSDIRSECAISERLAENIKLAYGACMPDKLVTLSEKVIQIEGDEIDGYKQIPIKYLSEIITCRAKEIIDAILYLIEESKYADSLRSGVVLIGGGANLANLPSYFKEISGYNVRIGRPRHLFSSNGYNEIYEPSASTVAGMIVSAMKDEYLNCSNIADTASVPGVEPVIEMSEKVIAEPSIPENAVEGALFSEEEVPKVEDEKKKRQVHKPKKEKKDKEYFSLFSWTKDMFNNLYDKSEEV